MLSAACTAFKVEICAFSISINLNHLKVHKNENFFDFDFEFCTISLLVMSKY